MVPTSSSFFFHCFQSESGESSTATKKNEIALAKVGLTIVLIFILCHSVKWIPNIYELVRLSGNDKRQWPPWIESTTHIAHFLMSLNSSVNFYVYCVKHCQLCRPRTKREPTTNGTLYSIAPQYRVTEVDMRVIAGTVNDHHQPLVNNKHVVVEICVDQ